MGTLFRPGASFLHRLPAGAKLLALIILVTLISIIATNPLTGIAVLIAILGLFTIAFPANGPALLAKQLWSLKYLLAIIVIPQLLFGSSWPAVAANALRLTDAILLASLFTMTTKNSEMVATIERASKPLKPLGVKPQTLSLAISMAINAIPMIAKFSAQTKEAQLARGVKPTAALMTVPLLVASLKYADDFAEALTARGVEI
jgi:biotin transport system permease protein